MHDSTKGLVGIPAASCDWLDVTFPTDSGLYSEACHFLSTAGALPSRVKESKLEYRLSNAEWGNFQLIESKRGWSCLSASGGSSEAP